MALSRGLKHASEIYSDPTCRTSCLWRRCLNLVTARSLAKEGHYHDAIYNKHNTVKVMIFDDLGGATSGTAKTIKGLAKNASGKGARDATDYGETHTKCFYQHHSTAMSLACVQGSAMSIVSGLENLERSTTYDRNKRANTSEFRGFLSAYGIAAA